MKLFLASEAKNPESFPKLEEFVGGLKNKRVVYIPTASNGYGFGFWRGGETIRLLKNLPVKLSVVELESYLFEDVLEKIKGNEIVWFGGGLGGYLLYWIRRVRLDLLLNKMLKQGVVYVGSSAGSMIAAKTQYLNELFPDDEERGASYIPGLGYIDFEILPHYEETMRSVIKKKWKWGKLYLLKDGEAITVVDGQVKVLGKEKIFTSKK